jgi:hypothetical protein
MPREHPVGRPAWRRAYDALEGVAGGHLQTLVGTEGFAGVLGASRRLEGRWRTGRARATASVLHAWNLPAHTDLQRLVRHIARLEARLRDLEHEVEDREFGSAPEQPATGKRASIG